MKIILLIIACLPLSIQAQEKMFVQTKNVVVGKNVKDNSAIRAEEFMFAMDVEEYVVDLDENCMYGIFKRKFDEDMKIETQTIFKFDCKKKEMAWSRVLPVSFSSIKMTGTNFILYSNQNSIIINKKNGEDSWIWGNRICYINEKENCILAYYNPNVEYHDLGERSLNIEGFKELEKIKKGNFVVSFSLDNGKLKWFRKVEETSKWDDVIINTDSSFISISSGLHCYNLKNGNGWDFNKITTISEMANNNDYAIISGLGLGLIGGAIVGGVIASNKKYEKIETYISKLCSNLLIDDSLYYFASKNSMSCVYKTGQKKWIEPLPEGLTGTSTISFDSDRIIIVNNGVALKNGRSDFFGFPYVLSIQIQNGKILGRNYLRSNNRFEVLDSKIIGNKILIAASNSFYVLDTKTLKTITEKKWIKKEECKKQIILCNNNLWKENIVNNRIELEVDSTILLQKDNELLRYNNGEFEPILASNDIYFSQIEKVDKYILLTNSKENIVVDNENKICARLPKMDKIKIVGNQIFYQSGKTISTILLADFY